MRAYVLVDSASVVQFEKGKNLRFAVSYKNTGVTPAFNVQVRMILSVDTSENSRFSALRATPFSSPSIIEPQGIRTLANFPEGRIFPPHILTSEEFDHIKSGKGEIVAVGQLYYDDTFGLERHTDFQLVALIPSDEGATTFTVVPASDGNTAD